jgi:ribosomal protein L32
MWQPLWATGASMQGLWRQKDVGIIAEGCRSSGESGSEQNGGGCCRGLSFGVAGAERGSSCHEAKTRYSLSGPSVDSFRPAHFIVPTPQPHIARHRGAGTSISSQLAFSRTIIMALARPLPPLWQALLPGLTAPTRPVLNIPLLRRLSQPFPSITTPFAALALPSLSLPSIPSIGDIWEGILKAVPKKKTSYQKKRSRFMAGKGLKDVTNLNKCSACGRVKRSHLLCPYCVHSTSTCSCAASPTDALTRIRHQNKDL